MNRTKIILITGVAGMLGSELLKKVLKNNIVIGIDNFELGKKIFIEKYLKNKNFYFFNLDLSKKINNVFLKKILLKRKIDQAWLLAANSDIKKGVSNSDVDLKNTFLTTYNTLFFIEKFLKKKTKIIFASSSAIYGNVKGKINENTLAKSPESTYGSMKLASENFISSFSFKNKIQTYIFRFPNVVGINITHGILYDFNKKFLSNNKVVKVLGNGNQQKPYSFSTEILDCIQFTISKINLNRLNIFNIGPSDNGIKVKEIVKIFKNFFPKKIISYQNKETGWVGDIPKYKYDTKKINKLGYIFKLNSKKSIIKSVNKLYK